MKNKILQFAKTTAKQFAFWLIIANCILPTANSFSQNNRLWATYYGGTDNEGATEIATDASGNVYITGSTGSSNFPTLNPGGGTYFQSAPAGTYDAFLVKFDASGNRLWATYYGGAGGDGAYSVAIDASGNVFITGSTSSLNFPTMNLGGAYFQGANAGGSDAFLVKFNSAGVRLWATYYGGTANDIANSIATDAAGNVYIGGTTNSNSGIAAGGFQNNFGGQVSVGDAFLVKFDASGARLWATYYGGTGDDYGYSVTADVSGNVYLAGITQGSIGLASGGFQNVFGGSDDAFLVKFDATGSRLWATYYGGTGEDHCISIVTDALGNVYLAGDTYSTSGIAFGGFQNTFNGVWDALLVKFDSNGNRLWATYYGGTDNDQAYSVTTDAASNVCLAGFTRSTSGIASGGFQNVYAGGSGGLNAFIAKFSASGNRLCATYYGGPGTNITTTASSVSTDPSGNVYLAGGTNSSTSIASGGFQNTIGGGQDAFLVKFTSCSLTVFVSGPATICAGQTATLCASGGTSYIWSTGSTGACIVVSPSFTSTYTVIATNATGSTGITSFTVLVNNCPCSVNLDLEKDSLNPLLWYAYPFVTGVAPFSYLWDFGDGNTSTQAYPTHTYSVVGNYKICLTITDALGCTSTSCDTTYKIVSPSSIQYLQVVNTTGIEENTVSVTSVFPNPAADIVELSLSDFVKGELKITDITGREVYKEKINSNNVGINVSMLPIGYYHLTVVSGSKTIHTKLMIAR